MSHRIRVSPSAAGLGWYKVSCRKCGCIASILPRGICVALGVEHLGQFLQEAKNGNHQAQ